MVESTTSRWTKQRKAEERGRARSRRDALVHKVAITIKWAAFREMENAYVQASGNRKYPAHARQMYYRARGPILKLTRRRELNSGYFTQVLVPQYTATYPEKTADWDVVYDARGHLQEPHSRLVLPLGTLDVRQYLRKTEDHEVPTLDADACEAQEAIPQGSLTTRYRPTRLADIVGQPGPVRPFKQCSQKTRWQHAGCSTTI